MKNVIIVCPCFNENTTIIKFLLSLNELVNIKENNCKVIVVDDASTDNTLELLEQHMQLYHEIEVISLDYNVGHQKAINVGLIRAKCHNPDFTIVIDSDGEDNPDCINKMISIAKNTKSQIINVNRGKRNESIGFKLGYLIYKIIFRLISGKKMTFGNYCLIDREILEILTEADFNHLAAYLLKLKCKKSSITSDRNKRISGDSKMNYTSLITHAFNSLIEFSEDLLMLFFKIFLMILLIFSGLFVYIIYSKFVTQEAISGWSSTMLVSLFNSLLLSLGFLIIGFLIIKNPKKKNLPKYKIYKTTFKDEI